MCLYPRLIINRKYTSTAKNGGKPPVLEDNRIKYVPIGCGNCIECRKQKARGWQIRLQEDIKKNINGKMITLTFSDEQYAEIAKKLSNKLSGYNLDNAIATYAVRHFVERWRKEFKRSIRHWLVTELGHNGTENIHLHGIIWTNETVQTVHRIWGYGHTWPRPIEPQYNKDKKTGKVIITNHGWENTWVNQQTVNYIIKYVHKQDEKHTTYKSKVLTSKGIGGDYSKTYNAKNNRFQEEKTNETYRTATGHKISMPIYWRNKMYTEEEREKLWIHRINKEERWVMGQKIDVSTQKGKEEYWKALKYHQKRNLRLGYGAQNDEARWEKKAYEEQQREFQQLTRIRKAYARDKKKANANSAKNK